MSITKAIIPVAGLGTRFLPASKSVPKELFPVLNKPVIQYLVEELRNAGIREVIFVINKDKNAIKEHFLPNGKLEKTLEERGKHDLKKLVCEVSDLMKYHFVEQKEPLGDGHAILCAKKQVGNEPCVVIFGDTLVDATPSMVKQMIQTYESKKTCVVSVMRIPKNETESYGIVTPKSTGKIFEIIDLVEKPKPKNAPSDLAVIGSYIVTPRIFEELEKKPSSVGNEIRLIDAFHLLKESEPLYGCKIDGEWLDTGTVFGWLKANIHMGLKNKKLKKELKGYIDGLRD